MSFETRRFPVGQTGAQPAEDSQPAELNALNPEPIPAPVVVQDSSPAETAADEPPGGEAAPATSPPEDTGADEAITPPGRYLVQVASFSTVENTNNLSSRLREDGLPVLLDTIEADAGTLHRVRVGPFTDLAQANAALETISARTPDLNPRIIDLLPDESAPVTEPSDPLVRWVVQAGSFAGKENSDTLVSRLKNAGFPAYVVTVTEPGGVRHKVRVGPVIERQAAVDLATDMSARLDLDGIVMSVD
ncbi:MAG: SPOR domain-containing protein [Xanthomonadales bacterium]|nr:SPOR domain-containing protein [Xanthomonadales bacterium]